MKAIIFDCDGVLVDSEIIYKKLELEALAEIGMHYELKDFTKRFMGMTPKLWQSSIQTEYTNKFSKPLPEDFFPNLKTRLRAEFDSKLTSIEGMSGLVKSLDKPKAVASSSELDLLHRKLAKTELNSFFGTHIYSGEQVEHGKPAPDLFLFAAANLNIHPEDCLVIEDSENGVKAGLAAGMRTIGYCGGEHCDEEHAENLKALGAHDIAMDAKELSKLIA